MLWNLIDLEYLSIQIHQSPTMIILTMPLDLLTHLQTNHLAILRLLMIFGSGTRPTALITIKPSTQLGLRPVSNLVPQVSPASLLMKG